MRNTRQSNKNQGGKTEKESKMSTTKSTDSLNGLNNKKNGGTEPYISSGTSSMSKSSFIVRATP